MQIKALRHTILMLLLDHGQLTTTQMNRLCAASDFLDELKSLDNDPKSLTAFFSNALNILDNP